MKPREKVLAAVVGTLLLALGGRLAYQRYATAVQTRERRVEALKLDLAKKQASQDEGYDAALAVAALEKRSLPANAELAQTLYQNWLTAQADAAGLKSISVDPGRGTTKKGAYHALVFTVRGRGTLEQAVRWLYGFYSSGYLHLIRETKIEPLASGRELDLQFTVEALCLPGAESRLLPEGLPSPLSIGDAKPYVDSIVGRNMFAPYQPPPPPPQPVARREPPKPPAFDPAKYAVLTAVVRINDRPQAWISVRPTGQLFKLFEGDAVSVGQFEGRVRRIADQQVEIESAAGVRVLSLGSPLVQAKPS